MHRLLFLLLLALTAALPVRAQEETYSVTYEAQPVEVVLRDLMQRTGYEFVYQKDIIEGAPPITAILRDATLHNLHERIAFVPQQATLFRGTVADNLRYGKADATEEEMWEALRIACAEDFIRANEQQLDLEITQNGTNLSGGQKQRLAIARAVIKKAEVLIFDDSFSALDFKTDAMLRQNIRQNLKNTNIIIVAQRVGTILDADRILVLEDGKLCGMGKHDELLETCSVYREIVESQLTKEDLAK